MQLHAGYFDPATPFYEVVYELRHPPIPERLQASIDDQFYEPGRMVCAHELSRQPPAVSAREPSNLSTIQEFGIVISRVAALSDQ